MVCSSFLVILPLDVDDALQVPLPPDGRARPRQRRGVPTVASVRGAAAAGERDVVGSS